MFFKKFLSISLMVSIFSIALSATATDVNDVRFWQDPEKTRLVFDVSETIDYKVFPLQNPYRLVIDIKDAKLKTDIEKIQVPKKLVTAIRSSQQANSLRVVIDLENDVTAKHFTLAPFQKYGHRLVIDLRNKSTKKQVVKTAESVIKNKNRDIIIVIDPGHGGEDPGAIGKKGTREKDVNLSVAKRLEKLINAEKGLQPFLTRSSDYYVGLEKRTKLARQNKADLFVSLHADGFTDPRVRGASVWTLSNKGANSEMGKWLEQRERSSDLLGGVESLSNKDELVAKVLLDLSMHYSVGESLKAAELVHGELSKTSRMHGKKLRKAAFMVLRMPDIPSFLVEMAFLSNPQEEKKLRNPREQKKIAKAIFSGIKKYFKKNPPEGSLYEALASVRSYKVKRGDTLSEIALTFGISTKELKSFNKLKNNQLRIGQTLAIPGA